MDENNFCCNICKKFFSSKRSLTTHTANLHGSKENTNSCTICEKTFYNEKTLIDHVNGVHKKIKNYKCDSCGLLKTKKAELNRHNKMKHSNMPKTTFNCDKCNKSLGTKTTLNSHIERFHSERMREKCEICNSEFKHRVDLVRHNEVIHEKKFAVKCDKCNKEFLSQRNLSSQVFMKKSKTINVNFVIRILVVHGYLAITRKRYIRLKKL